MLSDVSVGCFLSEKRIVQLWVFVLNSETFATKPLTRILTLKLLMGLDLDRLGSQTLCCFWLHECDVWNNLLNLRPAVCLELLVYHSALIISRSEVKTLNYWTSFRETRGEEFKRNDWRILMNRDKLFQPFRSITANRSHALKDGQNISPPASTARPEMMCAEL